MPELSICIPVGPNDDRFMYGDAVGTPRPEWELLIEHDPEGLGPAPTRNRLLDRAQGDYIMMIDADNIFTVDTIAKLYEERDEATIVSTERVVFFHGATGEDSHVWEWGWIEAMWSARYLLSSPATMLSTGNVLYPNTDARYPTDCGVYEGWAFLARRIIKDGWGVTAVPGTSYRHRLHDDSYYATRSREGLIEQDLRAALWHVYGDLLQ